MNKGLPDEMPEHSVSAQEVWICQLLKDLSMTSSTSEARRLVKGGAVSIEGEKVTDDKFQVVLSAGDEKVIKAGKKKFAKVIVG